MPSMARLTSGHLDNREDKREAEQWLTKADSRQCALGGWRRPHKRARCLFGRLLRRPGMRPAGAERGRLTNDGEEKSCVGLAVETIELKSSPRTARCPRSLAPHCALTMGWQARTMHLKCTQKLSSFHADCYYGLGAATREKAAGSHLLARPQRLHCATK